MQKTLIFRRVLRWKSLPLQIVHKSTKEYLKYLLKQDYQKQENVQLKWILGWVCKDHNKNSKDLSLLLIVIPGKLTICDT